MVWVWWTPHPVIVTIRDPRDYIRVLLYSSYTTITGWRVLLRYGLGFRVDCEAPMGLGLMAVNTSHRINALGTTQNFERDPRVHV